MALADKKVAILVHNYFEQSEFEEPLYALKSAGVAVTVVSTSGKQLQALKHVDKGDKFQADLHIDEANPEDYDALVLPGGAMNSDKIRMIEPARQWVNEFLDTGRIVAAICHAPWLLVSSGKANGRKLTSYYTIQDDIRNAGGEWLDVQVVVDQNLITSRQPDDLEAFSGAIIEILSQQQLPVMKSM